MKRPFFLLICSVALFGAGCATRPYPSNSIPAQPSQDKSTSTTEVDLSGKELTVIPMNLFSQTDLVSLNLSKNKLTDAPPSQIGQLKNLVSLDLSNNALTGLPAELGQLKKLEILNISNNKLTGLPMELGNLTQLRILNISGNTYSSRDLDEIAKKLPKTEIQR